jgi:hypothetical protein
MLGLTRTSHMLWTKSLAVPAPAGGGRRIPRRVASCTSNFMVSTVLIFSIAFPVVYTCAFAASALATARNGDDAGLLPAPDASGRVAGLLSAAGFTGPGRSSTLGLRGVLDSGGWSLLDGVGDAEAEVDAARRKSCLVQETCKRRIC